MLVIKIGGSVLANLEKVIRDIAAILEPFVLVHGGGRRATPFLIGLGRKPESVISRSGVPFRRTTKDTLAILNMVASGLNTEILALFARYGRPAIGLSGPAGNLIVAQRKNPKIRMPDGKVRIFRDDYTGLIQRINVDLIEQLLALGLVPVISFIAMGEEFELLNTDADRIAVVVASAMKADKLVYLTDVEGVRDDHDQLLKSISRKLLPNYIEMIFGGMKRKLMAAQEAKSRGVPEILITDEVGKIENNEGTLIK